MTSMSKSGRQAAPGQCVALFLVMFVCPGYASQAGNTLSAEQWELSRQGEKLVELPVLRKTINTWSQNENQIIELQYPGGEEGELWANELKDWLISLGVPSKYLVLVPGSGHDDIIRLELVYDGERFQ